MRVVYLTTESYFREPIIKSQVEPLLNYLSKDNFDFILVTFERNAGFSDNLLFTHKQLKFTSHLLNMIVLIYYAFKISNKNDVIHVRSYPPMLAALLLRLFKGNKVIFDPRGLWPEEMSYTVKRPLITFLFKCLENLFCRYSSKIVLVSKAFENLFIERYPCYKSKFIVVPTFSLPLNFVFDNTKIDIKRQIFKNEDIVLFVYSGSFETWQKIDKVVEYFQFLELNVENSRFLFLTKSKELFDKYLNDKLSRNRFYIYSANQKDIGLYLSQCDYGIIFRDKHIINIVSAPIKIKDYLTANLRVLLSDNIGDSSDLVAHNQLGFVFRDYSKESMISSLEYINSINHKEIYQTNSNILDVFSLKFIASQYKIIYNEM